MAEQPPARPTRTDLASRLNWLRAGVLGANDGIVSTAALILGFAGATAGRSAILLAGLVGLLAGAMSMAAGEYVSVSTQRDSERAVLTRQRRNIARDPHREYLALTDAYVAKGIRADLAAEVARQLTESDPLRAHAEARHGIDPDELTNPWHAAFASFVAFSLGALVPLLGIMASPSVWTTGILVVVALAATGSISAKLGDAPVARALIRNVGGGTLAMLITFGLGSAVGIVL